MINIVSKKWNIDNIDAVFFDKDGTIIDSHFYWGEITKRRVREIISYFGLKKSFYSYLCKKMGFFITKGRLSSKGPTGLQSRERVIWTIVKSLREKAIIADFKKIEEILNKVHLNFLDKIEEYTRIIPDAYDFILKLKKERIKLALITSDSIKNTLTILRNSGIENIFDIVIGRENCEKPKVSGEPALLALKFLGVNPSNTIVIGDAPMDKIMAENACLLNTVLVATGQIGYNSLKRISNYTVRSLKELDVFRRY